MCRHGCQVTLEASKIVCTEIHTNTIFLRNQHLKTIQEHIIKTYRSSLSFLITIQQTEEQEDKNYDKFSRIPI